MTGRMSVDAIPSPLPGDAPVAIARQAIHDRWTKVVGYALLLRDAYGRLLADDEEQAATRVIVETLTGIGLAAVAGDLPAHVRATRSPPRSPTSAASSTSSPSGCRGSRSPTST